MTFDKLSYYEALVALGSRGEAFLSVFPSVDTYPVHEEDLADFRRLDFIDRKLFLKEVTKESMVQYLRYLNSKNFGFDDFIGYLIPPHHRKSEYNLDELCNHFNNLRMTSIGETGKYDTMVTVSSPVFPGEISLRMHRDSSPQKAFDTSVMYVDSSDATKITTTIGYKKKSSPVKIIDGNMEHSVLRIGMFGWLYGAGEHVNANEEGIRINETIVKMRSGKIPFSHYKDVEIANRAMMEEIGISVEEGAKKKFYVCGVNNDQGRDPRYWSHLFEGECYGYMRSSESVIIVCVIIGSAPDNLSPPTDPDEIEKSMLIPLDEMKRHFGFGKKYEPAFPVHEKQFHHICSLLPEIVNHMAISN